MKVHLFPASMALLLTLTWSVACAEPPSAPSEYEDLLAYVFEHAGDEEDEALAAGLENLHAWLQDSSRLESVLEGYVIDELPQSAVAGLDAQERSASGARGMTVVTLSPHSTTDLAKTLTWERFDEIVSANFTKYIRTFEEGTDLTCFQATECSWVQAQSDTESKWVGIVEMETGYTIQFRWVATSAGWMLVHRFWLRDPAHGEFGEISVDMTNNYYIGVTMGESGREGVRATESNRGVAGGFVGGGEERLKYLEDLLTSPGSLRVHANWFQVDVTGLDDSVMLNGLIDSTQKDANHLDTWITENGASELGL